jgi:hypothetical protein
MGCDIHFNVERRENDRWRPAFPEPQTCCQCGGSGQRAIEGPLADGSYGPTGRFENCSHCSPGLGSRGQWLKGTGRCLHSFYNSGRNYTLFGVLAGVRDSNVQPIDWPRGLPPDLSEEFVDFLRRLYAAWERCRGVVLSSPEEQEQADEAIEELMCDPRGCHLGYHSISWLTVRELLEYNWPQPHPNHSSTLADDCDDFLESLHQRLLPLGHPDDVRIIFGFDS